MKVLTDVGLLPKGFLAAGISSGIKKSKKMDLGLLFSPMPCVAAGLFTANKVQAAPLMVCREHLKKGPIHAVVVNSGNANCMTGAQGIRDAVSTTQAIGEILGVMKEQVLVSSTGIIGRPLPLEKIKKGALPLARALSAKGISQLARAIMTTDTFPKEVAVVCQAGGRKVTIAGIAKGAGMLAPQLKNATMLAYIATDAAISQALLKHALRLAVHDSFNAITIDACMSTNDTVIALANGAAGNRRIASSGKDFTVFLEALKSVCVALSKMIIRDAEGATKFITIDVEGAASGAEAERLAFSVANSNLFKCAMFGSDPNWGRIAAALGSVPSHLDWEKLDIAMNRKPVFKKGKPVPVKNNEFLKGKDIHVQVDLHQGNFSKRVYTSDLSYGYVRINADYN
jgi:glutamate N-acetyltransferase / amino-acid N-acetyltransferase